MSLNIESCYSFSGSLIKKGDIESISKLGYRALGLVDNNTAFFLSFYEECLKEDIKPILGLRVKAKYLDYVLYARNFLGYKEILYFASSRSRTSEAQIDELIFSKNLIYVMDVTYTTSDHLLDIREYYNFFKMKDMEIYLGVDKDYYPLEIDLLPKVADSFDIIIMKKVKYLKKEDKEASEVLESILLNTSINKTPSLFDFDENTDKSIPSHKNMYQAYNEYPEIIKNTQKLIEEIDIKIDFDRHLPEYPLSQGVSSKIYLEKLAEKGLQRRILNTAKDPKVYQERLRYELSVIDKMGFNDYFLIVYDYILYAKKNGIMVGPGRGSSASSLVSYSLGIVDVDPLVYSLYFERFLNPARKTMPDIDTDFEDTKRDAVVKYVQEKYGRFHVTSIATFQTFLAKSSLRDVSKILGISDIKVAQITKEIDSINSLDSLLTKANIKKSYDLDEDYKKLIDISLKIEGLPRSVGTHAAGIIISKEDIREYSEVHNGLNDVLQTTYDSDALKDLGLLKMDFLALKNLSVIHDVLRDIQYNENKDINILKIKLDDKETFNLLRNKSTLGIFQLESPGMTDLLKKMQINNFLDLSLCIALYRPGPMENIPLYLKRRFNKTIIDYYDDSIKDILMETLGIIVYQEQIMAIVSAYAGFSLAEADILRRAMSDKDASLILDLKQKFYSGAKSLKRKFETTERLFKDIYKFSGYGFNKSHSVSYGLVAYQQAYLKAHYQNEFMANLLKNSPNPRYFKECQSMGIKVFGPDIRYSSYEYRIYNSNIYMPFTGIKGIGMSYAKSIEEIAKTMSNNSFETFVKNSKNLLPKSLIELLILSGAFDYTSYNKRTMIEALDGLYEFDEVVIKGISSSKLKVFKEYDFEFLKNKEADLLGYNPKYHPISIYKGNERKISDLTDEDLKKKVQVVSYVSMMRELSVKASGELMASLQLEDEFGSLRGIIFPKEYLVYRRNVEKGKIYLFTGIYELSDRSERQLVIREISELY